MQPRSRKELVAQLIEGRSPIAPLRTELAAYPWDLDEPLVILRSSHIEAILRRYMANDLTAANVAEWAEALEMRDDVGFDDEHSQALSRAIFVLANPDVNGPLTLERAERLMVEITHRTA